jgi:predicted amidophosphoribosyltransferase
MACIIERPPIPIDFGSLPKEQTSEDGFTCPHCDAQIPSGTRYCPQCGSLQEW